MPANGLTFGSGGFSVDRWSRLRFKGTDVSFALDDTLDASGEGVFDAGDVESLLGGFAFTQALAVNPRCVERGWSANDEIFDGRHLELGDACHVAAETPRFEIVKTS